MSADASPSCSIVIDNDITNGNNFDKYDPDINDSRNECADQAGNTETNDDPNRGVTTTKSSSIVIDSGISVKNDLTENPRNDNVNNIGDTIYLLKTGM